MSVVGRENVYLTWEVRAGNGVLVDTWGGFTEAPWVLGRQMQRVGGEKSDEITYERACSDRRVQSQVFPSVNIPCGQSNIETRLHILTECPTFTKD